VPQLARFSILALLLALTGCGVFSSPRQAASCSGPMVALNPERWSPAAEDMR
jgi:hypothetical protein